jgi:hypothetical protein
MNSGTCVVDLEQWTGLKGALVIAVTKNLTGVKWSTKAGISTKGGRGTVTKISQPT